jgi:hypothetical protein
MMSSRKVARCWDIRAAAWRTDNPIEDFLLKHDSNLAAGAVLGQEGRVVGDTATAS